jgi:thiol-disulfide isomerase/thioredoxin
MNSTVSRRARRATTRHRRRPFPIWLVAAVVIVILGAVVAIGAMSDGDVDAGRQFGTVEVTGEPLPGFGTAPDPAVGAQAPQIAGVDFDGRASAIGGTGRPTLVVFLAHWCPHCNREAPRLAAYLDRDGVPTDVDIVLVPTGSNELREHWPPSEWIADQRLDRLPVVLDTADGEIASAFGLGGYPFIVLLDAAGTVIERRSGEQPEGAFAEMVASLRTAP